MYQFYDVSPEGDITDNVSIYKISPLEHQPTNTSMHKNQQIHQLTKNIRPQIPQKAIYHSNRKSRCFARFVGKKQ